jgi:3-deoxy-7-phosphoheptulonate synthase
LKIPNYHYEDLLRLADMYVKRSLSNLALIVDTSHANSQKMYQQQPRIAKEVLHSREHSDVLKKLIKGLMIESYLVEGSQDISGKVYGQSITDPCLGWEESQKLVREIAENI